MFFPIVACSVSRRADLWDSDTNFGPDGTVEIRSMAEGKLYSIFLAREVLFLKRIHRSHQQYEHSVKEEEKKLKTDMEGSATLPSVVF